MSEASFAYRTLRDLADHLDALSIPFVVGGSLASTGWGEPRATNDIDLLIALEPSQVPALVRELAPTYWVSEAGIRDALAHRSSFNVFHKQSLHKLDLFVRGDSLLDRLQLERRVYERISSHDERTLPITSPEDIVLRKLAWYRASDESSERQWRDVLGVLKVQRERLDLGYLRDTAARLELAGLLARALDEAGLAP